jgi:hypothetical protein
MIGVGVNIPRELFLEIKALLTEYEYWKLLITANPAFDELRFSTRMIYLNYDDSNSALKNINELQALASKVQSTKTQLYLKQVHMVEQNSGCLSKLDCFSTASCDPALVSDFLSARFGLQVQHSDRSFVLAMRQDSLKIFNFHIEMQFSSLKNLKRLCLHDCSAVTEVHSLRDLESLEISCCNTNYAYPIVEGSRISVD